MDKYITLIVTPEQKILIMEKNQHVKADEMGNLRLNITELMMLENPKSIWNFERELEILLSEDERYALYAFSSTSKGMTITGLASAINKHKDYAKGILNLGVSNGVFTTGWNNTWKVADTVMKDRLSDKVKNRHTQDKKNIAPETMDERFTRLRKMGFNIGNEKENKIVREEGMIVNKKIARHESSIMESPVEIVPEVPSIPRKKLIIDIQVMKQDLKDLEELKEQMRSGIVAETVECNEHILIDKMKSLRVQITNAEIQESNQQFDRRKGIKMNESGSAMNVTMIKKSKQEASSQTLVLSKKVLTKGTPLSRTPHGKAHKSTRR